MCSLKRGPEKNKKERELRALRGEKVFRKVKRKLLPPFRVQRRVVTIGATTLAPKKKRCISFVEQRYSSRDKLRTMRRIRTHGCVYSFRLDACIRNRHRCRMRHVRVHVPDLCEPRPLTSRLLVDARTFDILTNLKLCSSLSLKHNSEKSILESDRFLIWIGKKYSNKEITLMIPLMKMEFKLPIYSRYCLIVWIIFNLFMTNILKIDCVE